MAAQFDMFAPPPMSVVATQPNGHGVYSEDEAERICLPNPTKGWRGPPLASVSLLHVAEGWVMSVDAHCSNSGFGSPLMPGSDGYFPTRDAAVDAAKARLRKWAMPRPHGQDAAQLVKITAWVETLI